MFTMEEICRVTILEVAQTDSKKILDKRQAIIAMQKKLLVHDVHEFVT